MTIQETNNSFVSDGEYVLDDFLELACGLGYEDRMALITALRQEQVSETALKPVGAFLLNEKLVLVLSHNPLPELLIYSPKERMIKRGLV